MTHLPRLLKIIAVAAKYRLHTLSPLTARSWLIRLVMGLLGLPWTGHAARRLSPEQRLRTALEELGPIYIKFGQLLSTRRDFLPHALADELQSLQDRVPGFTSPSITSIVEAELESPWHTHFSHINSTALA